MLERVLGGDVPARLADHHAELDLVVELPGHYGIEDHRLIRPDHAERSLQEELGVVLLDGRLLVPVVPVVLAAVQDDRRDERRAQAYVCERVRRRSARQRLLGGLPRRLEPGDEGGHRAGDPDGGDLGRVRLALDLGEVCGIGRLQADDGVPVDSAERTPCAVLEGDEPHATGSGSRTPRPASASRSAGRSASGKSGKGRRTGPQSSPSIRSASFVGDT
jgi:hypothetical protein